MKKIHLVIEAILAVAVIALFILHFTSGKKSSAADQASANVSKIASGSIAYVNIDTVIQNYAMFDDLKKQFESKKNRMEAELGSKSKNYQSRVLDYQNKVSKGLITRAAAAELEQDLTQEQQKLYGEQQQAQNQLVEEEGVMHRQLLNSIMEFLAVYNKDKGFTFILGNSFGGNILYADSKLDITADVVKKINTTYKPGDIFKK